MAKKRRMAERLSSSLLELQRRKEAEQPLSTQESEGYVAYFDGSCWPNPNGHAAWGALVKRNGEVIFANCGYLGHQATSNNVAEYAGLNVVLDFLLGNSILSCVIYGDSNLVIKQMNKEWSAGKLTKHEKSGKIPIRARYYMPQYLRAQATLAAFPTSSAIAFRWTPREKNIEADELSTRPLRKRGYREVYSRNIGRFEQLRQERGEELEAFDHATEGL